MPKLKKKQQEPTDIVKLKWCNPAFEPFMRVYFPSGREIALPDPEEQKKGFEVTAEEARVLLRTFPDYKQIL